MSTQENIQIVKDFVAAMGGCNKQDLLALPLREAREQFERAYLQQQLLLCNGKVGQLARELSASEGVVGRAWPQDPRARLRLAAQTLAPQALRSVADFSVYLAATGATPPRRRIGFTL